MPYVLVFLAGLAVGSFLNVCMLRIPEGESIVFPGSHCRGCRKPIAWFDNIPVVSFVRLKGRCRHCGSPISAQYPCVELLTGAFFVLFYATLGLSALSAAYLVMTLMLLTIAVIDWRHQIIPDVLSLPGLALGAAASGFIPGLQGQETATAALLHAGGGILLGGGALYAIGTIAEWLLKKEAMGGGDVKLLAMIGAWEGWRGVLWALFLGSLIATAAGLYERIRGGGERISFGPYLAAAAVLYIWAGPAFFEWYGRAIGISI